jgi:hypothetical protein
MVEIIRAQYLAEIASSKPVTSLLPRPGGFEHRIPVGVLLHVDDLAVAKREYPELLGFGDFDPTPSATSTPTNRYHDLSLRIREVRTHLHTIAGSRNSNMPPGLLLSDPGDEKPRWRGLEAGKPEPP